MVGKLVLFATFFELSAKFTFLLFVLLELLFKASDLVLQFRGRLGKLFLVFVALLLHLVRRTGQILGKLLILIFLALHLSFHLLRLLLSLTQLALQLLNTLVLLFLYSVLLSKLIRLIRSKLADFFIFLAQLFLDLL